MGFGTVGFGAVGAVLSWTLRGRGARVFLRGLPLFPLLIEGAVGGFDTAVGTSSHEGDAGRDGDRLEFSARLGQMG